MRFIYTTRSKVPEILDESGKAIFVDYEFRLGKDDLVCGGACVGYVVAYGDALYRSLDAVQRLRAQGLAVGLVNKCHVNQVDEEMLRMIGQSHFVLVVERRGKSLIYLL